MMDSLIDQREQTHGDYAVTASLAREFKSVVEREAVAKLTAVQRESLDLICTKIARILSGNANDADHWRDIAGYARLVEREISGYSKEFHWKREAEALGILADTTKTSL